MNDINKQIFTIDTSVARPHDFQIFRGETVGVECRFNNYIEPLDLTGMTATLYWRSPDMAASGDSWYSGDASVSANKATFTWVPSADAGADEYEWYLKVAGDGASYRAFGLIEMLGSPSTNPIVGPVPHSNYYNKDETDSQIHRATEHLVPDTREINGHALTADVNLTASDVGALPDSYTAPVTSVNSKTGAVTLTASDVGAATEQYVNTALSAKQDVLTFDNVPTANSDNPVKSSGIKTALDGKADTSALASYLPLSGGEINGDLGINGMFGASTVRSGDGFTVQAARLVFTYGPKWVNFINSDGHIYTERQIWFPDKSGTFALTSDIDAAVSGKASTADATLTPTYSQNPTFTEWVVSNPNLFAVYDDGKWALTPQPEDPLDIFYSDETDINAVSFSVDVFGVTYTATRTRTDIAGYILGSQNDKPLQPAGDLGMLSLGSGTTLSASTLVYATTLTTDGSGAATVSVDSSGIPTGNDYYCFEMEIAVPVNTLSLTWPSGWAWVGEMPTAPISEGKTVHLACRLDCREGQRGITANAWEIV